MQIHISPKDGVPIFRQIVNQVKYLVGSGRLEVIDLLRERDRALQSKE